VKPAGEEPQCDLYNEFHEVDRERDHIFAARLVKTDPDTNKTTLRLNSGGYVCVPNKKLTYLGNFMSSTYYTVPKWWAEKYDWI
jgi:hypothetical protein